LHLQKHLLFYANYNANSIKNANSFYNIANNDNNSNSQSAEDFFLLAPAMTISMLKASFFFVTPPTTTMPLTIPTAFFL